MRVPVFVSCPTKLSPSQDATRKVIIDLLEDLLLEPRALGRSDYPSDYPLREVYTIARHCSGGLILGFEQCFATAGRWKRGTKEEREILEDEPVRIPTPWNHLEAGILFGLRLPLMIFREPKVSGGVFDPGVTDVFVHTTPDPEMSEEEMLSLRSVFLKWRGRVSEHYYQ